MKRLPDDLETTLRRVRRQDPQLRWRASRGLNCVLSGAQIEAMVKVLAGTTASPNPWGSLACADLLRPYE